MEVAMNLIPGMDFGTPGCHKMGNMGYVFTQCSNDHVKMEPFQDEGCTAPVDGIPPIEIFFEEHGDSQCT